MGATVTGHLILRRSTNPAVDEMHGAKLLTCGEKTGANKKQQKNNNNSTHQEKCRKKLVV